MQLWFGDSTGMISTSDFFTTVCQGRESKLWVKRGRDETYACLFFLFTWLANNIYYIYSLHWKIVLPGWENITFFPFWCTLMLIGPLLLQWQPIQKCVLTSFHLCFWRFSLTTCLVHRWICFWCTEIWILKFGRRMTQLVWALSDVCVCVFLIIFS